MRRTTLVSVAGGGLAATLALGAALPALASDASPGTAGPAAASTAGPAAASTSASTNRAPLTRDELVTIDRFYENHPVLGHRMVARIDAWKTFLANHPKFAAKLAEWKDLPPAQRRAAEHAFLAKHPALRHDVARLRADRREFRKDLRELRQDLRH